MSHRSFASITIANSHKRKERAIFISLAILMLISSIAVVCFLMG